MNIPQLPSAHYDFSYISYITAINNVYTNKLKELCALNEKVHEYIRNKTPEDVNMEDTKDESPQVHKNKFLLEFITEAIAIKTFVVSEFDKISQHIKTNHFNIKKEDQNEFNDDINEFIEDRKIAIDKSIVELLTVFLRN